MNISVYLLSHCHFLRVTGEAKDGGNKRDADSPPRYLSGQQEVLLHTLCADGRLPASSVTHAAAVLYRETTPFPLAAWLDLAFFVIAQHSMTMQLFHCTMAGVRTAITPSRGMQWEYESTNSSSTSSPTLRVEREGCATF